MRSPHAPNFLFRIVKFTIREEHATSVPELFYAAEGFAVDFRDPLDFKSL